MLLGNYRLASTSPASGSDWTSLDPNYCNLLAAGSSLSNRYHLIQLLSLLEHRRRLKVLNHKAGSKRYFIMTFCIVQRAQLLSKLRGFGIKVNFSSWSCYYERSGSASRSRKSLSMLWLGFGIYRHYCCLFLNFWRLQNLKCAIFTSRALNFCNRNLSYSTISWVSLVFII